MNILLTVHQFFPDYSSGTEVLTLSVARELRRRGHRVTIVTGYPTSRQLIDEARVDDYYYDGFRVFRFHHAFQPLGRQEIVTEIEYDNRLASSYFARILEAMTPDVVHFFHLNRLGAGLIDVTLQHRVACYYTPTDFWAVCPLSQLLLGDGTLCSGPSPYGGNCVKHYAALSPSRASRTNMALRTLPVAAIDQLIATAPKINLAAVYPPVLEAVAMGARARFVIERMNCLDAIFSPTRFMTETLVRHGVDVRRIQDTAFGIDMSRFHKARSERTSPTTARTFAFIGTLSPHKGCHVLIEAFKRLDASDTRLLIYGDLEQFPEYGAKLRSLAENVASIEFRGTFPESDIVEVLDECDALVVPSLWYENTPLVIYSALAAGRPVIGSDFPGISAAIRPNENGLLFPAGNADALSAHMRLLAITPGVVCRLRAGCAPPKSIETYVGELETTYAQRGAARATPRPKDVQVTLPLGDPYSYIAGWVAVAQPMPLHRRVIGRLTGRWQKRFVAPASIGLLVDGTCVSETERFLLRPDIREGLLLSGWRVGSMKFGFVLRLPEDMDRRAAGLEIRFAEGRTISVPLEVVPVGSSTTVGPDALVGVEAEHVVVGAGQSGGPPSGNEQPATE